ncbi:AraC family transcriptional regulator [Sinanaerobacter chloroacetimidivorans]|jgi:AraC-like DNA-binding protein/mannose-6-phosphate isomerase-like protein (cupin superfamily)|uniref:Helix-turn-helix transcriptional regulator n=1 Tax=Sinanaerobacter chloroacetimidivorans TaxID=2818044 RepID=A0A8J7W6E9_9FIRM|nr:AraC family transcriptional regulator [Sinanaerobacter chloroacetimidivorans]MBR0599943.1 helix-turn-helix transcriptional regulator [Sinanaerobacter chloroacetimidivorans]
MLQSFNNQKFLSSFQDNTIPALLYSCKTEDNHVKMPRVMHRHEDKAEVVFITCGSGVHYIDGKKYYTKKGDLLLYNAGVIHDETANPNDNMNVYCIAVSNLNLKGRPINHFATEKMSSVINVEEDYEKFLNLLEIIHENTLENSKPSTEIANYLLRTVIVMIDNLLQRKSASIETEEYKTGKQIKKYIDEHYADNINLDTIASHFNMNLYYLGHIFKDMVGYSPMQYVIRRRIGEAQSLLINTDYSVTQIATTVGYNNTNHFHSVFYKMVGMTPAKYRKYWVKVKE